MKTHNVWLFLVSLFWLTSLNAQCPLPNAVIYESEEPIIPFDTLADLTAPILWFSPDEPHLFNSEGEIVLPQELPYDTQTDKPTVYFKIKEVFTALNKSEYTPTGMELDLRQVLRFEIEYYLYYREEQGAGSHPHDLESVLFQVIVHRNNPCLSGSYALEVKRVVAKAHGIYWFNNVLNVDAQTRFPMVILVEEGKHGTCTDKNGDGIYTPGFDVNEKPNDTWGIRDIISTGDLFTGSFQAWMAKPRVSKCALFPPVDRSLKTLSSGPNKIARDHDCQTYTLRPFPPLPENYEDDKLARMVKSKRPEDWPRIHYRATSNKITKVEKQNVLRNKVGFSVAQDLGLEVSVPLLLVKHVKAPMTGGWFYHKVYTGNIDYYRENRFPMEVLGHQVRHSNSASRWLDTYVGMGYEFLSGAPTGTTAEQKDFQDLVFVSEVGIKIRGNITVTPFRFLKFLGTEYWGVSMSWRNRGFNEFGSGSFVLTFGAGAF